MTEKYFVVRRAWPQSAFFMPGIFHGKIDCLMGFFIGAGGCATSITHTRRAPRQKQTLDWFLCFICLRRTTDVFVIQIRFDYIEISRSQRPSIIAPPTRQMQMRRSRSRRNWGKLRVLADVQFEADERECYIGAAREESENWWVHVPKHRSRRRCPAGWALLHPCYYSRVVICFSPLGSRIFAFLWLSS